MAGNQGSNAAQLKDDINRGRTGGKIPLFDPAAAPLGTDEEAAGTPISAAAADHARMQEIRRPARPPSEQDRPPPARWSVILWAAGAAVIALALVILMQ